MPAITDVTHDPKLVRDEAALAQARTQEELLEELILETRAVRVGIALMIDQDPQWLLDLATAVGAGR